MFLHTKVSLSASEDSKQQITLKNNSFITRAHIKKILKYDIDLDKESM